ncbi:MAG: 30S ribosomal protein S8e [Promethearchaeota archaeon]
MPKGKNWQGRSNRLRTGARLKLARKKRKRELAGIPIETRVGKYRVKKQRVMGGNYKLKLFYSQFANVTDPTTNKSSKQKILRVLENRASVDYNRRSIITKGALIETESGTARVTSRPGQHGVINAVLEK